MYGAAGNERGAAGGARRALAQPVGAAHNGRMAATLSVGAVQLQSDDRIDDNLSRLSHWVQVASDAGARVVVLPENFAYFGSEEGKRSHAEDLSAGGVILDTLRSLCARHSLFIIGGGMPERSADPDRPYNTSVVVDPSGQIVARYRKLHLFDVELPDGQALRESEGTSPGDDVVSAEIEGFRFGLSICYDLRFPALYASLARQGVDVVTVPAAFTLQTGKDHWHVLLRARAIEGQAWVVAAAQWGQHPRDRRTYGHSLVVDPWGTVVAESSEREGVVTATLDQHFLAQVRRRIPCALHRREL